MKSSASTFVTHQKISTDALTLLARSVASILPSCLELSSHSCFHWHVQHAAIPCRSQDRLPYLSVIYPFLLPFSTNWSSILLLFLGLPLSLIVKSLC